MCGSNGGRCPHSANTPTWGDPVFFLVPRKNYFCNGYGRSSFCKTLARGVPSTDLEPFYILRRDGVPNAAETLGTLLSVMAPKPRLGSEQSMRGLLSERRVEGKRFVAKVTRHRHVRTDSRATVMQSRNLALTR